MKILYFGSVPAPYQNEFWIEVGKVFYVKTVYLASEQEGHAWKVKDSQNQVILSSKWYFSGLFDLFKMIAEFRPDRILIGGYNMKFVLPLVALLRFSNIKIIFWLERPLPAKGLKKYLKKIFQKLIFYFVDKIFTIGNDAYLYYSQLHSDVTNFSYALNCEKFLEKPPKKLMSLKFLFVGQFINRKGILEAIRGFMMVEEPNISFDIIGGGKLNDEINQIIKKDSRINNLGYIDNKDFPEAMKGYDVFIFPSRHDGWALTLVEAMSAGLYILSTRNVSAFNEYILSKEMGLEILTSSEDIKEKIIWCVRNYHQVIEGGRKNQKFIFSSLSNAKNAASYFKKIIE